MKKAIYFSTAALLLMLPSVSNAQSSENLSPTEVFCSNLSAESGNAIRAIKKIAKSNRLSFEEKQVLIQMSQNISSAQTVESICLSTQA